MKKLFLLIFLLTFSLGQSQNKILNGTFAAGTANWGFGSPGVVSGGEAYYSTANAGAPAYGTELKQQGMTLTSGAIYTVTFRARAAANRLLSVNIQNTNVWNDHFRNDAVALTTTMTTYSYSFTATATSNSANNVQLNFHMAGLGTNTTAAVYIDDVSIMPGNVTATPCANGIQDIALGETGVDCGGSCGACLTAPTYGAFTVPAKLTNSAPFTLTPPTSTNTSSFTYTSSNTAVATVSGSTVTIVGVGTSTITANQVSDGTYSSGSTTASLVVTVPLPATPAPNPPARNSWDVISYYSDTNIGSVYAVASAPTWGGQTSDTPISGNATKFLGSYLFGQIAFANKNVTSMSTLHIDLYSLDQTTTWIWLNNEKYIVTPVSTGVWTSLDIPLSTFVVADKTAINIIKIESPTGAATPLRNVYVDNIYFYKPAATIPVLTTTAATSAGNTVGTLNGNISSSGASNITSYGFYYSTTNGFADGAGTQVVVGTTNTTGAITSNLTGLSSGTNYYYKAYATNTQGTAYGAQQTFTTTVPVITGNIYINDGTFAAGDYCTAAGQDVIGNDGSAAKPFLTLAYALSRSTQAAGNIIYIDTGTYSWSAVHTFTASGTLASPITIQGKGNGSTIITSTAAANSGLYFSTGNYWTVKDLQWNATTAWSARVDTSIGITLQNCIFNFTGTGATIQSVVMANAGGQLTIKNCTLTRNNIAYNMIELVPGASLTLQDNTFSFPSVNASGTLASVAIQANASSVFIIERNKFSGGGYGIGIVAGTASAANASSIIKNNFFNTNWGIVNTFITGLKVYNNSFYTAAECVYGVTPSFLTNWDIQNNIFYTYGGAKTCVLMDAATATAMNYNHYYYPSGTGAVNVNGTVSSLATWKGLGAPTAIREVNGQGGALTANNPLYVSTTLSTTDLHLQGTSPAIGVGSSTLVTDDIDGNARPLGGTYEMGAAEYVPGAPTISNFPAITKVMGDAAFSLGTPTSNSGGAWTYSITVGNGTVATLSGSTVTLVAAGTATIRATQAAFGSYISGYIEATLTVSASPVPLTGPTAPPARNSWDKKSIYGSAYTNEPGVTFATFGATTSIADFTLADASVVKKYVGHSYSGIQVIAATGLDVAPASAGMTTLHMDVYSPNFTSMNVKLQAFNGSAVELAVPGGTSQNTWNSYDIPLSSYSAVDLAHVQYIVPVTYGQNATLYITNVYFYRAATTQPPTLGTFTVPAKLIGDAAFTLTPPTSNSAGAFTYTSSNTAVATISGSTVTIVGAGTSTITATQAANGGYGTGSTTATLSVTPPAAPTPIARNTWDVVSFYSGTYTPASTPTWGGQTADISISGNTTRLMTNFLFGQIAFANTDVSAMTWVHVDVFSLDQTPLWFWLGNQRMILSTPINGWTSLDIPLSSYATLGVNLATVNIFKIENPNGAGGVRNAYVDNIYFYRDATLAPPSLGALTVPTGKIVGDAPFVLTNPTTNSSGTFSYSSSDTAVATISGNTVTIVGGGSTTITATVASDGTYGARSTTANLTIDYPTPGASPIPPIRDSASVISMYTGTPTTYANGTAAVQASWSTGSTNSNFSFANGTNTCIQVNNLGFFGLVGNTNFSVVGMTKLHVDIYVNSPMTTMILNLLAPTDRNYSIGPLTTGWNSFDIPLTTYPGALNDIAGIKFEQSGGTPRQIYLDNIYFYKTATWSGTTSTNWATASNWAEGSAPTATSDVVIASSSNQPIIGSDVSVNSLTINTGTTLTVNSGYNLTVANAVANSGTMTLQNNANLLQSAATTTNSNTGSIIVKRNSASLLRLDHTLWSSPVASQNLYGFSPATLTNRFYTYNTGSNGYVTTGLSSATSFLAGKGYAVRAPNDHTAVTPTPWEGTFTGIPNNGTVPFTLDTSGSGFNLVGNPYPSPVSATSFLAANSTKIEGTFYFYAHSLPMNANGTFPTGTNYSSWNGSAGTAASTAPSGDSHLIPVAPNGIIQVGQGFFVKAKAGASGDINFTNAIRVGNNANQFFRTTEIERHRLWLNLTTESGTDINQIAVAYVEGATQNADTNFDGLSFGNTGSMLSSKINGANYVIQGRSLPFDSNDIVPLGFKATTAGNYKIVLTDKDGLFLGNQDVFVRDNLMGVEHNIKVSPYTFASEIGTFDTRFQLVYTQTLGIPSNSFTPNSVLVYKNTDGFHVSTNGIVMKDILVYDISGRLIFKQANINGTATILKGLSQIRQVLLLKITSQENETVTVKVIN